MNKAQFLLATLLAGNTVSVCAEEAEHKGLSRGTFEEQGFSGEVRLFAGFGSEKDNMGTSADLYKISSLDSEGKSESNAIVGPMGQARYTFGTQQVFLGMSQDNIVEGVFALEAGYAFEFDTHSVISLSIAPTIIKGEAWQDPYLINVDRKKTDVSGNAYRILYENILDIGLDADFAFYDRKIDNERSGSSLTSDKQLLKRDGSGYLFSLSTGFPIAESTMLMPSIGYHQFSADGDAMSFSQYDIGLTAMHMMDNHAIALNLDYSQTDYDAVNPIFNKTRDDKGLSVNLTYEYREFMGWDNTAFNFIAGYDNSDSNIDFYDNSGYMIGFGLSYQF